MITKYKKTLGLFIVLTILIGSFAFFTNTHAKTDEYIPLSPIPGTTQEGSNSSTNLTVYLIGMFKLLIGVAGALAVVMIVVGGIQYMSTDAVYGKSEGKARINQAIAGLLLALVAWLILYTINPDLLKINAGPPSSSEVKSQSEN